MIKNHNSNGTIYVKIPQQNIFEKNILKLKINFFKTHPVRKIKDLNTILK